MKNITKDFFKISKTQKLPTRTKNLNNFKKSCKEASDKKESGCELLSELKNIKKDMFTIFNNTKMTLKSLKTKKLPTRTNNLKNFKKSCKEASDKKNQDVNYCQN